MADDAYYRITKDEALFNAYIAYANTNNPDDQAKIENLYDLFKKGKISTPEFNVAVMQAAKAQGKTDAAKQGGTPTTDGAHTEKVAANPGNGIDAQGKSEIPNSSVVSDANAAKTQANAYDPSVRLNNNVQYVINLLKTYGYSPQVLDSFKQNIDKILANTKDTNRIDAANQYIDQFLGDKQDLRRQNPVPGKPALDQQPQKAGNKNKPDKPRMSDDEIDAFLKEELGGNTTGNGKPRMSDDEIDAFLKEELGNGTYASAGVPKGGTKTMGYDPYDPNPGGVSLAYTLRNEPEQVRRAALIDAQNRDHGISYVTGKDGVIYRIDPQHPNGTVDPIKNDLSTWTRATKAGSTYATPGISTGGTYATGEGIKDANGNVLTNPGGNWEYQYALRDPSYGVYAWDRMTDAQKEYLKAVSNNMGFNYDPSRNAPSSGEPLTYDPKTSQLVPMSQLERR